MKPFFRTGLIKERARKGIAMGKRAVGLFCGITVLFAFTLCRLYYIAESDYLSAAATTQGRYGLQIAETRGVIYDRSMQRLVNTEYKYIGAVLPTPQAATALVAVTQEEERPALMERLSGGMPFAMELQGNDVYAHGVDIFRVAQRYGGTQYAPHLIGYLTNDGKTGAAGIEKAYDQWLDDQGGIIKASYQVDAAGRAMQGGDIAVSRENEDPWGGVVLTLDRDIQQLTQNALRNGCEKGAAVVMDVYTGDIVAMASIPDFDQNNISASLDSPDAPFVNRAVSGYNIGSVFKLVVASAALENNVSRYHEYECEGYVDVDGQVFRCNNNAVHGAVDLERALQVSCNCYFINLAQEIGADYVLSLSQNLGLGSSVTLAPGMSTQPGNLPTQQELELPAAQANFSFGQGSSLASPLQMASVVSAIANSGLGVSPRLVQGTTEDGLKLTEQNPVYASNQVLSESTAAAMRDLMVSVVEEGSGKPAKPILGSAGGKTSSAQTGVYAAGEDGEKREIVHAWFAGFYPAQKPRYAIVVFVEDGESGELRAAPIFKQIADGISGLEK